MLLEKPEQIVSYVDIYEQCLDEKLTKEEILSDITVKNTFKGLKKDLGTYLKNKGMSDQLVTKLKSYIKSKKNQGYLLKAPL